MIRQFCRFDFHEIRFHVLDDPVADAVGQKIDNGGMDFGGGRERPTFLPAPVDNLGDLIGQLFVDPAISFIFKFALGDGGGSAMRAGALGHGKPPGQVGHFVDQLAVGIGDVERLNQFQTRTAGWRFVDLISFQAAAICCDDE